MSGWSFTVKQSAATIHEDSVAGHSSQLKNGNGSSHTCSIGLPKKWQPDMQLFSRIQWACDEKAVVVEWGSPDWHVTLCGFHLQTEHPVNHNCPGHAGVEGNDQEDRLVGKAITILSGLHFGRSEVLRSLSHYLLAHMPLITSRREA